MIHHYISNVPNGAHWAVNDNGQGEVLVQVQDECNSQTRIRLTVDQAIEMLGEMCSATRKAQEMVLLRGVKEKES